MNARILLVFGTLIACGGGKDADSTGTPATTPVSGSGATTGTATGTPTGTATGTATGTGTATATGTGTGTPTGTTTTLCPLDRTGITGGVGQELVVQSVRFADDTIVIRNISANTVTFAPDGSYAQPSWRVYADTQANGIDLPANHPIAAGATLRIHLTASGTDTADDIYMGWSNTGADLQPHTTGDGSEVAILAPNNGNQDPTAMRAYLRWGGDDAFGSTHTFRDEAAAAGMWAGDQPGDFVFLFETDEGLTVDSNGDATDPTSWTNSAPPECL